jgi:prepilin-type N-terminal cleavage/methylation domain-containing protein
MYPYIRKIRNPYTTSSQRAFTLVELLVYIAIFAVMIVAVSTFMIQLMQSKAKHIVISEVEQQGLMVMQEITQAIRNAEAITSPTAGNNSATISIDALATADDPTLFDINSDIIRIKEGTDAYVNLTNSKLTASALNFSNISRASTPGTIKVQFTLTYYNPESTKAFEYEKTFYGSASLR